MSEAERCEAEIRNATAAVLDRCGFGEYIWMQDWREELALIRHNADVNAGGIAAAA